VTSSDPSAASNNLATIDLGVAGDRGRNYFQAVGGANPNQGAGMCISMSPNEGALALSAEANLLAGSTDFVDCGSASTAIVRSTSCTGGVNIGIIPVSPAGSTTVTVDLATCQ
jgi:hypothetical protein